MHAHSSKVYKLDSSSKICNSSRRLRLDAVILCLSDVSLLQKLVLCCNCRVSNTSIYNNNITIVCPCLYFGKYNNPIPTKFDY